MKKKIHVVDNEKITCDLVEAVLSGRYHIIKSYSGREALEKLSEQPDAILTDYRMPRMTGYDMAVKLRQSGYDGRIFLMSGNMDEVHENHGDAHRYFDGFLRKPFFQNMLVEFLNENLEKERGMRA